MPWLLSAAWLVGMMLAGLLGAPDGAVYGGMVCSQVWLAAAVLERS